MNHDNILKSHSSHNNLFLLNILIIKLSSNVSVSISVSFTTISFGGLNMYKKKFLKSYLAISNAHAFFL